MIMKFLTLSGQSNINLEISDFYHLIILYNNLVNFIYTCES